MKSILSYKLFTHDLNLTKLIDFFFICERTHHNLYLYQNNKACRIHKVTELILYILTAREDEVLFVVEGFKAPIIMGRLIECVYGSRVFVQEA